MSEKSLKKKSETDWHKLRNMDDSEINYSDIPPLDDEFLKGGWEVRMPCPKSKITIRLDQDVVDWFKSFGNGYQTKINAVLRSYMEADNH